MGRIFMPFLCETCIFGLILTCVVHISAQDMYGAQYETRQRVRPPAIQNNQNYQHGNMPLAEGQSQPMMVNPCRGTWQWACENLECIAQYDICDGIEQCSDGSDEKNCEHRNKVVQEEHQHGRQVDIDLKEKPATTHAPTTTTTKHPNITTTAKSSLPSSISSISVPVEYLLIGLTLGICVALVLHCMIRKRRIPRSRTPFRKGGQAMDDDEDDLLISQMYS